jgi:Mg2+/Co2+ transporter CorB
VNDIPLNILFVALGVLLLLSAFFSGAETSMMAVNRHRLRHQAKLGSRGARLAESLLARTDQLLAVILLGNNLLNAAAAALVTLITMRLFGQSEFALTMATLAVTFLILVFSEVTPKVVAAAHADRVAPWVSFLLAPLTRLLSPVVWFINLFVRALIRLLCIRLPDAGAVNQMGVEELRSVLAESGLFLRPSHRNILLNLFELEKITVDDVMHPRSQIEAIDLEAEDEELVHQLETSHHAWLVVYAGDLNEVKGVVSVRRVLTHLRDDRDQGFDREAFATHLREPYFIPAGTPLLSQLAQFQRGRHRIGLVVDEYGELLGLLTMADILIEIVGEFDLGHALEGPEWLPQADGSFLVEGGVNLRELNRKLGLFLPMEDARTLNGLILEHLEAMPEPDVTLRIAGYPIELLQVQDRMVKTARIYPRLASGYDA